LTIAAPWLRVATITSLKVNAIGTSPAGAIPPAVRGKNMWRWIIRIAVATVLAGVVALGIGVWYAARSFHPPPEYYQEIDYVPQLVTDELRLARELKGIAVDHVYYYRQGGLVTWFFLRCHIVRDADFKHYVEAVSSLSSQHGPSDAKYEEGVTRELADAYGHKEIQSWWDWASMRDQKVYFFPPASIVVFDEARHNVYIGRGTTF
jgi:hypothetical protein